MLNLLLISIPQCRTATLTKRLKYYAGVSLQTPATVLCSYHYDFVYLSFNSKKLLKTVHIKLSQHHHIDENARLLVF